MRQTAENRKEERGGKSRQEKSWTGRDVDKLMRRTSYRQRENNKMIEGKIREAKNASETVKGGWDGEGGYGRRE